MIHAELEELGMDPADVEDMFDLADMMMKFLTKIPEIEKKLELDDDEYSLEDHSKLYLLGLPNKLGPLGFLALHSILESVGEAIADIQIGEFVPEGNSDEPADEDAAATGDALTPLGDLFTRKWREVESKASMMKAAEMAKAADMAKAEMAKVAEMAKAESMAARKASQEP